VVDSNLALLLNKFQENVLILLPVAEDVSSGREQTAQCYEMQEIKWNTELDLACIKQHHDRLCIFNLLLV
jgi:hypothetical protein